MRKTLVGIYERLLKVYGQLHWWPAKSPFEVIVGAILTQNTAWSNVEKAIRNLEVAQALSPAMLVDLPLAEVERLIQPSGYFRQKAQRLRIFARHLMERHGGSLVRLLDGPLDDVRKELLELKGIGPETADSILLYAAHFPTFVVDAYTVRIFSRLGILDGKEKYGEVRDLFLAHLPHDSFLFNEYHALIVEHGKTCCRKKKPLCNACSLSDICFYYGHPG
ncbi:MAG: endonuclease III domain-containing protein [Desulfuromonadaceae bacterium]|nr:endonuclease III domain-containing protein [Desulfuromonadaceae bacterium]